MPTVEVNLEEFKRMAKELVESLNDLDIDQLENGVKCLGLAWIGLVEERPGVDKIMARGVYDWAMSQCNARELDFILGG